MHDDSVGLCREAAGLTYERVCGLDVPHTNSYVKWVGRSSPKPRRQERAEPVPRDESKQRTREALVVAALELFAEEGLDAPSLDAICDRAGYTRGAFYVHFPDRDALLVAVMEKVGEAFLSALFSQFATSGVEAPRSAPVSLLAEAAQRFVATIAAGAYPLMPPDRATKGPQIRPHQLLDACARSPIVRDRYRSLVEASIAHVAQLTLADQATGFVARELDAVQVGTLLVALVIGAQTMAEVGLTIDPEALGPAVIALLKA